MVHNAVEQPAKDMPWYSRFGGSMKERSTGCSENRSPTAKHISATGFKIAGFSSEEARFALAEVMEAGAGPGLVSAFVDAPPQCVAGEERFIIERCEKGALVKLQTAEGDNRLHARERSTRDGFDIFIGGVGAGVRDSIACSIGPSFVLTSDADRSKWTLESARCCRCEARWSKQCGRRELMRMSHYKEEIGLGEAVCMDVKLPTLTRDGTCAYACKMCGPDAAADIVELSSKRPKWNPMRKSLALNFYGRCNMASAKNFQLVEQGPVAGMLAERYKLLFGKCSEDRFVLDYRYPLGMVQAFAAALSTSNWG
mmetsp:Transcript_22511/g.64776  ORF Transcript_22511/g.64776 Transcript_22511/m.64776 type:complete len:312 (-) Transcript_22511:333-1268(-)